ncbi:MAG TPA: hypothetical protein VGU72_25440 [Beijerinckiaceae bacterium]|jgi:hypothetical protein|nr:hypothetical protein [Beijerinckiaceae bacterium]
MQIATLTKLSLLTLVVSTAIAEAAPAGLCQKYANDAAYQYHKMMATPACKRPPSNLWHNDKGLHYSWCLTAPMGAVKSQVTLRDHLLAKCDPSYGD